MFLYIVTLYKHRSAEACCVMIVPLDAVAYHCTCLTTTWSERAHATTLPDIKVVRMQKTTGANRLEENCSMVIRNKVMIVYTEFRGQRIVIVGEAMQFRDDDWPGVRVSTIHTARDVIPVRTRRYAIGERVARDYFRPPARVQEVPVQQNNKAVFLPVLLGVILFMDVSFYMPVIAQPSLWDLVPLSCIAAIPLFMDHAVCRINRWMFNRSTVIYTHDAVWNMMIFFIITAPVRYVLGNTIALFVAAMVLVSLRLN